jgi:alginate O-acetyltransferase complex protein AlgI
MLFPTIEFFLFFLVVFAASWALNSYNASKKWLLLAASYFFYAQWDKIFVFLLLASALWNFGAALLIERARDSRLLKPVLISAVGGNLLLLGYFKYYDFLTAQIVNLFALAGLPIHLGQTGVALPVAISFLTFHGISYIVDVHRQQVTASRSIRDVMLYMAFFPHLVAGPIVRAADFLQQLATAPKASNIRIGDSTILILSGLFKKVIVAGHLTAFLVDPVFADPNSYSSLDLVLAAIAYAVVIYCDFSGYTDIAIGIANLLGYHFPMNFNQPYRALSLQDFWRRWHITLSSWLRDYLYVPLGGNRHGSYKTYRNLMLTMLLGGLWHGAGAQFVVWGALHGAGLAVERALRLKHDGLGMVQTVYRWAITFTFVVVAWIFFRSPSLEAALDYLRLLFASDIETSILKPFILALVALGMAMHFTPCHWRDKVATAFERLHLAIQVMIIAGAIWLMALLAPPGIPPFIYFQF